MFEQFKDDDTQVIAKAADYETLVAVAIGQLNRMRCVSGAPIGIVCGPISAGPAGTKEENMARFSAAVDRFKKERGGFFFSQIGFEERIWQLKEMDTKLVGIKKASQNLLDRFYLPLFKSCRIDEMHFLPDWDQSEGAKWERKQGHRLGIRVKDIEVQPVG